MKKRSAFVVAAGIVGALMAGAVSRQLAVTHPAQAAAPTTILVAQQPSQAPAVAYQDDGGSERDR